MKEERNRGVLGPEVLELEGIKNGFICRLPWWLIKESACNAGDWGLIPGSGSYPGEGNGNPLQYSFLENFRDRRACGLQSMGSQRVGHN